MKIDKCLKSGFFLFILLALFLSQTNLSGCGGGSGDSSLEVIQGNVSEQVALAPSSKQTFVSRIMQHFTIVETANAGVSGVQVRIRNSGESTVTDESGFFRLEGQFQGDIEIEFLLSQATVSLSIDVAEGSTVTLQDIKINTSEKTATPSATSVESHDDDSNSSSSSSSSSSDDDDDDDDDDSSSSSSDDDDDDSSSSSSSSDDDDSSSSSSSSDDDDDDSSSSDDDSSSSDD